MSTAWPSEACTQGRVAQAGGPKPGRRRCPSTVQAACRGTPAVQGTAGEIVYTLLFMYTKARAHRVPSPMCRRSGVWIVWD